MNRHQRNKLKAAIHSERLMIWIICENWDMEDDVRLRERSLRIQRNNRIAKERRRKSHILSNIKKGLYSIPVNALPAYRSPFGTKTGWFAVPKYTPHQPTLNLRHAMERSEPNEWIQVDHGRIYPS